MVGATDLIFPAPRLVLPLSWGDGVLRVAGVHARATWSDPVLAELGAMEMFCGLMVGRTACVRAALGNWLNEGTDEERAVSYGISPSSANPVCVAPRQEVAIEVVCIRGFDDRFMWRFMEEELAGNMGWGFAVDFTVEGHGRGV